MKRKRHTPEQIVRKLREGDRMLNEGTELTEVLRHLEVSESSWARWRAQYGGMKADEAKRLKELERENGRLKKLLAEPSSKRRCSRSWLRELLTPERRRRAMRRLQEGFGVSERFACRVAGQHRSTQREPRAAVPVDDGELRSELRAIAKAHPRWGYKMATRVVRRQGWRVNRKRVQRLWREEGLKRPPQRPRKRRRVRIESTERLRPRSDRIMCGRSISSSTRPPTSAD